MTKESDSKGNKMISVSIRLTLIGILLFSIIYPVLVGGVGQIFWNNSAEGSPIRMRGEIVGSELIGQEFNDQKFFHPRPSGINYNATMSASQNLAPNNLQLKERVKSDLEEISNWSNANEVPSVLVTESGSGLDPHITTEAAMFQVSRVSESTGISEKRLQEMIENKSELPLLGVFGQERVNVLELNILIKKELSD